MHVCVCVYVRGFAAHKLLVCVCVCMDVSVCEWEKQRSKLRKVIIMFAVVRLIITHLYAFRLMQLIPKLQQERVNPGMYSRGLR